MRDAAHPASTQTMAHPGAALLVALVGGVALGVLSLAGTGRPQNSEP